MRIACLVSSLSRNAGGIYDSVRQLCLALATHAGTEVHVLGTADAHTETDACGWAPVSTHAFAVRGPVAYGYAPGLKQRLFELDADILLTNGLWMYPTAVTLAWRRRTGRPFIVSPHGMLDGWALRSARWKKWFAAQVQEDACLRQAACLRAVCDAELQSIRARGWSNPVCVIPNGVEISGAPAPRPTRTSGSRRTLLYLGRLHPKKGLVTLLQAWAILQKSRPRLQQNWNLVIAGWSQDGHEQALRDVVRRWRLNDTVRFAGALFGAEKLAAFRDADAFVLPSLSEGLPVTVLEAWAQSLPVLMTPQCHLPEGFEHDAAICAAPEVDSLADGLETLFAMDDDGRARMGERGFCLVAERFNPIPIGRQMHEVCRWLVDEGPRPSCLRLENKIHEPSIG